MTSGLSAKEKLHQTRPLLSKTRLVDKQALTKTDAGKFIILVDYIQKNYKTKKLANEYIGISANTRFMLTKESKITPVTGHKILDAYKKIKVREKLNLKRKS